MASPFADVVKLASPYGVLAQLDQPFIFNGALGRRMADGRIKFFLFDHPTPVPEHWLADVTPEETMPTTTHTKPNAKPLYLNREALEKHYADLEAREKTRGHALASNDSRTLFVFHKRLVETLLFGEAKTTEPPPNHP